MPGDVAAGRWCAGEGSDSRDGVAPGRVGLPWGGGCRAMSLRDGGAPGGGRCRAVWLREGCGVVVGAGG